MTAATRTPSTDDMLRDVVQRLERLERIELGDRPAHERCAIFRAALTVAQERIAELTAEIEYMREWGQR